MLVLWYCFLRRNMRVMLHPVRHVLLTLLYHMALMGNTCCLLPQSSLCIKVPVHPVFASPVVDVGPSYCLRPTSSQFPLFWPLVIPVYFQPLFTAFNKTTFCSKRPAWSQSSHHDRCYIYTVIKIIQLHFNSMTECAIMVLVLSASSHNLTIS